VHRDIKPQNIFIGSEGQFILGDFGLVYFDDDRHTRLSGTLENVGTRDWMPGWAMGMRVEDVRPTFDVFALGKVLWSLISGRSLLPLWYFNRPQHDLTALFPDSPHMARINSILARSIVEEEEDCLPNAAALLAEIDEALISIRGKATVFDGAQRRKCLVCAVGSYQQLSQHDINNSGMGTPAGERTQKIFACSECGHVQQFITPAGKRPALWGHIV
jgi:serine/threonine protein kinase